MTYSQSNPITPAKILEWEDNLLTKQLRIWLREQAYLADKSSHEWKASGVVEQAAYRSGMWYAFHEVEMFLDGKIEVLKGEGK